MIHGLKMIILTPFAFWKEIIVTLIKLGVLVAVVWIWVLVIKVLLKYLAG
jgi:hypothetical protein